MLIYTRSGDDGTTGLYFGGRVPKDSDRPIAYGEVDEAQAFIGLARSLSIPGSDLDLLLIQCERDLWVLMAELATDSANRHKLLESKSVVSAEMVTALEDGIDAVMESLDLPKEFVVPGGSPLSAQLDVARTVVRRAERAALAVAEQGSYVGQYLNRLSDLLWALARQADATNLTAKDASQSSSKEHS